MLIRIYRYFSKPIHLVVLNALLIAILIVLNLYFQAFCIPSTWAILVLIICFANMILSPLIVSQKILLISSFINGVSLFVFGYFIVFLDQMNIFGLFLILMVIGLVVFIPHFFVLQLIWRNLYKPKTNNARNSFLLAVILCITTMFYVGYQYKKAVVSIDKFIKSDYTQLDKNFITEKILGMHFIYHTRFCEYDGWRPPIHEPILIIGMWMNNQHDQLSIDLKTRLEFYKKFFPEKVYKFECSCAIEYSESYHNDALWE